MYMKKAGVFQIFHPRTFQMRGTQEKNFNFVKNFLHGIFSGST